MTEDQIDDFEETIEAAQGVLADIEALRNAARDAAPAGDLMERIRRKQRLERLEKMVEEAYAFRDDLGDFLWQVRRGEF